MCCVLFSPRKNVEDFTGPRERSDLGFVTFDITADILNGKNGLQTFWNKNTLMLFLLPYNLQIFRTWGKLAICPKKKIKAAKSSILHSYSSEIELKPAL